ncbi:DHA2 family multidrug resistance protein [Skermanella aerolata]|uniref:DHA2 family efflux MFS transporter permease subunit n=1 Tax=Skermanella aerolata TaxID=393310 RepID=UPI003D1915EC
MTAVLPAGPRKVLPFLFRRTAPPASLPSRTDPSMRQSLGFYAMVAGLFLAIVDTQLVTSSMKEIQGGLSAGLDEIGWVQSAYLIGEIVMIALAGTLSRAVGTRLLFTLSAIGFAVASLLCGMASSLGEMTAARALQGFLGGAMIPTLFAANILMFPPAKQVRMTVLIGLVATLAPTIGPALGGMVTQALSWRWLFFITVLPGLAVAWAVWLLVDIDKGDKAALRNFDSFGASLLAISLGSLQYVLHEGPRLQWLDDGSIRALLLAAALAGALLVWRCLWQPAAILNLGVFRDRNFTLGCLFNFALGAGLFVGDYLMAQYLGRVRGLNSEQIGYTLLVTGAFEVLGAPVSLWLATRVDPRYVLALGYALFASGLYLATGMTADWDFDELFWSQAVRGFSLMLCFVPVTGLALGTLSAGQVRDASGLFSLTRNLGGAIGLAWVATAFEDRTVLHRSRLAESLDAFDPQVQDRLAGIAAELSDVIRQDPDLAALRVMSDIVNLQAEVMAFNDLLLMLAGIMAVAVLLLPFVRRTAAA